MNRVMPDRRSSSRSKPRRGGKKRRYEKEANAHVGRPRKMKRTRQKSKKSPKYLSEYSEYESSRMDLSKPTHVQKVPSDGSVIYVKSYPQRENIPVIDLTRSSHSILCSTVSSRFPSSTSVKLIYKSSNFKNRFQRHLATSLLTIPMRRGHENIRSNKSNSNLTKCSKERLSILDIPPELFDEDTDGSEYAFHDLSKADLNEEDRSMIECIAMREKDSTTAYHLENKQPIENICQLYGVTSEDNFV